MKKIFRIILILILLQGTFQCIKNYPEKTRNNIGKLTANKDLGYMAEQTNSKIANINQVFFINKKHRNFDNSYISINFYSFLKGPLVLKIENISTLEITANFLDNSYFIGYDKDGNELRFLQAQVKVGVDLPLVEIKFEDISKLKYLVVGGMDRNMYQTDRIIYEI